MEQVTQLVSHGIAGATQVLGAELLRAVPLGQDMQLDAVESRQVRQDRSQETQMEPLRKVPGEQDKQLPVGVGSR